MRNEKISTQDIYQAGFAATAKQITSNSTFLALKVESTVRHL